MPKGFQKGKPRHPQAGRQKGTLNKKTQAVEQFFNEKGILVPEKIMECLPEIESAKERAHIWMGLMEYIYPKRRINQFDITPEEAADVIRNHLNEER